jgi:galactokinase/mevalonate kinase-like predicted kinase
MTLIIDEEDSVLTSITRFSANMIKDKELPSFLVGTNMDDDKEEVATKPVTKKQQRASTTTRQILMEMRSLTTTISCDTVLSNGERVGEFLLKQWLAKEKR